MKQINKLLTMSRVLNQFLIISKSIIIYSVTLFEYRCLHPRHVQVLHSEAIAEIVHNERLFRTVRCILSWMSVMKNDHI